MIGEPPWPGSASTRRTPPAACARWARPDRRAGTCTYRRPPSEHPVELAVFLLQRLLHRHPLRALGRAVHRSSLTKVPRVVRRPSSQSPRITREPVRSTAATAARASGTATFSAVDRSSSSAVVPAIRVSRVSARRAPGTELGSRTLVVGVWPERLFIHDEPSPETGRSKRKREAEARSAPCDPRGARGADPGSYRHPANGPGIGTVG